MRKKIIISICFICVLICLDRCIGLILNNGLNMYFGLRQHSEVLLVGHSHLMLAVDKESFEKGIHKKVSKYCREGVNVVDRYHMVRQYIELPSSDSLKIVLYGVDQFMFNGTGLSHNSYKLFYPFIDEPNTDKYIKESTSTYDYWLHKIMCSTRYSDALINSSIRGWMKNWGNFKAGTLDVDKLKLQIMQGEERRICFEQNLIDTFEKTLKILTDKNIIVVLVNTPIAQILNEYEPVSYCKIIDYFHSLDESSELIYYWDFNPEFSGQYELFYDAIHLNQAGQKVINKCLIDKFNETFHVL